MKAFRFPLQKALDLRMRQLELEEAKLQQAAAALAAVDRERESLLKGRADAEALVRAGKAVPGEDLAALGAFRLHTDAEAKRIAQRRAQSEGAMEEQRKIMLEARRKLRLLEKLRERRYAEWSASAAKELEEMASESYLARWAVK
jgi:flagellar protein FliJ